MPQIPGLTYIPAYLSYDEQKNLLEQIDALPWISELRRRVQHYGYRYDYRAKVITPDLFLGHLPGWAQRMAERLHTDGYAPNVPEQVIVNEYIPGQGIAPHVDCVPCFGDTIMSLSLGSTCLMTFSALDGFASEGLWLEPGSLLVMTGEARYQWKHGIPARKNDVYKGQKITRARRVSLTLRGIVQPIAS